MRAGWHANGRDALVTTCASRGLPWLHSARRQALAVLRAHIRLSVYLLRPGLFAFSVQCVNQKSHCFFFLLPVVLPAQRRRRESRPEMTHGVGHSTHMGGCYKTEMCLHRPNHACANATAARAARRRMRPHHRPPSHEQQLTHPRATPTCPLSSARSFPEQGMALTCQLAIYPIVLFFFIEPVLSVRTFRLNACGPLSSPLPSAVVALAQS